MRRRTLLEITGLAGVFSGCLLPLRRLADTRSVEEIKRDAKSVDYDALYRNIGRYRGTAVHYIGRIANTPTTEESYQEMIVIIEEGPMGYQEAIWGYWNGRPYRTGDMIEFWGIVRGLKTYTSISGERTLPEIDIVDIEIV